MKRTVKIDTLEVAKKELKPEPDYDFSFRFKALRQTVTMKFEDFKKLKTTLKLLISDNVYLRKDVLKSGSKLDVLFNKKGVSK